AKIGKKTIKNVPLSFAARSSDIPMKVFGNDLLKRFNVIFDFQKNEIYLKPNGLRKMNYNIKK
ncbi:MAG: clan AA aspartic protease, partial [Bacteroidetes bacterium B1(2017)]